MHGLSNSVHQIIMYVRRNTSHIELDVVPPCMKSSSFWTTENFILSLFGLCLIMWQPFTYRHLITGVFVLDLNMAVRAIMLIFLATRECNSLSLYEIVIPTNLECCSSDEMDQLRLSNRMLIAPEMSLLRGHAHQYIFN